MARIFTQLDTAIQAAMQFDNIFIRQVLYDSDSKQEFQLVEKISETDFCVFYKTKTTTKTMIPKPLKEKIYELDYK